MTKTAISSSTPLPFGELNSITAPSGENPARTGELPSAEHRQLAPEKLPLSLPQEVSSAQRMIGKLINQATQKMPSMTQSILAEFRDTVKRPSFFKAGYVKWGKVETAAAKADQASAALAKIPASAFREIPLDAKSLKALENYIKAQNNFAQALQVFQDALNTKNAVIENFIDATQFRESEALSLAARMQIAGMSDQTALAEDAYMPLNTLDAMRATSPYMHGADVFKGLANNIADFLDAADALEANRQGFNIEQFRSEARKLADQAEALRNSITQEKLAANTGVVADEFLRSSLEKVLLDIVARLQHMADEPPIKAVENALTSMLQVMDTDLIAKAAALLPPSCQPLMQNFYSAAEAYNGLRESLIQDINTASNPDLPAEMFEDRLKGITNQLRDPNNEASGFKGLQFLFLLRGIGAQQIELNPKGIAAIQADVQRYCGISLSVNDAKKLGQLAESLSYPDKSPLAKLIQNLKEHIGWVEGKIIDAEAAEVSAMYANLTRVKPQVASDYLLNAIDRHVSMPCLIDAVLRGLPMDQLELRAEDEVLKSAKTLGSGAVNSVSLCTFRGENGEDLNLVFKPETEARRGIEHMFAGRLGYAPSTRIMQINVAAWRAAYAIGAGDVIAKSSIGMHQNRMGLFMEAAPGKTAWDFMHDLPELISYMGERVFNILRANLMRELSKLEWADMLSGQADRHSQNYLIHADPHTGAVKVTGIDNDASFGARRLGMTKINLFGRKDVLKQLGLPSELASLKPDDQTGLSESQLQITVDADNFHGREFAAFHKAFGFNQLFRPTHIDRETYDKLININNDDYLNLMRQSMDEGAAQAALARLNDAKSWAEKLAGEGRVINGPQEWADSARIQELKDEIESVISNIPKHTAKADRDLEIRLRLGFFARDFSNLIY